MFLYKNDLSYFNNKYINDIRLKVNKTVLIVFAIISYFITVFLASRIVIIPILMHEQPEGYKFYLIFLIVIVCLEIISIYCNITLSLLWAILSFKNDTNSIKIEKLLIAYSALTLRYSLIKKIKLSECNLDKQTIKFLKILNYNNYIIRGSICIDLLTNSNHRKINDIDLINKNKINPPLKKVNSAVIKTLYSDDIVYKGSYYGTEFEAINSAFITNEAITKGKGLIFANSYSSLTSKMTQLIALEVCSKLKDQNKSSNTKNDILYLLKNDLHLKELDEYKIKYFFTQALISNYFVSFYFNLINWDNYKSKNWMNDFINHLENDELRSLFEIICIPEISQLYSTITYCLENKIKVFELYNSFNKCDIKINSILQEFPNYDDFIKVYKDLNFNNSAIDSIWKQMINTCDANSFDLRVLMLIQLHDYRLNCVSEACFYNRIP
ncbi:MAG4530 family protein [Mycoplasma seminis]|uniref:Uncharacterized protein n=1 Tax=Mycoplasma seminis TaxID=512749 RepID=A0ABY9HC97_9MOLU|nr:hypothetical protein [Mycoplasma seminis]WLP85308.1 hypothetical protein Q8852_03220 [Mycoplasma seminis]